MVSKCEESHLIHSIFHRRSLLLRLRRRIALIVICAMLVGAIAHASHFHGSDFGQYGDLHADCLLCTYMAGSAGPPDAQPLVSDEPHHPVVVSSFSPALKDAETAPYDARGPPHV